MDKRKREGRREQEIGILLRCGTLKRAGALCSASSSLGKGWGGEGRLIVGSLFWVLTFTFYLLVGFYVASCESEWR